MTDTIHITPREKEVLHLICAGKTSVEIGAILGMSEHTAYSHQMAIRRKAGVYKDTALVAFAFRSGLVK
jgi:LuxR family transcriptional regulator of spore coat protein